MILEELLLQKLVKWRPDSPGAMLEATDPASGWTVRLGAECVEQVGSRLTELSLARTAPLVGVDLKSRAERLAARTTGLLEPLHLVEVDLQVGSALLRSDNPSKRGADLHYYEVVLRQDGNCSLKRYQASQQPGIRRQAVPFSLTHDLLAKLIDDLTAD